MASEEQVGNIVYQVQMDVANLIEAQRKVNERLEKMNGGAAKTAKSLDQLQTSISRIAGAIATSIVVEWGRAFLVAADNMNQLNARIERLTVTTGSGGETITTPDPSWPGFTERTLLDATVTGVSDDYEWVGPFLACPDGETLDAFEVNINFQSGLVRYTDQGNKRSMPVRLVIQYRKVGTTTWQQQSPFYSRSTENQIGLRRKAKTVHAGTSVS